MGSVAALHETLHIVPKEGDRVEQLPSGEVVFYSDGAHRYWWLTEKKVPLTAVSSITRVIDKGEGLLHWVRNVTLAGEHFRDVRDAASTRGTSIHKAAEHLANTGEAPRLGSFPEGHQGYVQALASWWLAERPKVIATEVIVASLEFRFAGRFDLLAEIGGRRTLVDFKTSGAVHPKEMFAQLEAYEGASIECGYPPTDERLIVRLGEDGTFEVAESCASYSDFLAIKAAFDACKRIEADHKALLKAVAA
jgi:hypothetical protein